MVEEEGVAAGKQEQAIVQKVTASELVDGAEGEGEEGREDIKQQVRQDRLFQAKTTSSLAPPTPLSAKTPSPPWLSQYQRTMKKERSVLFAPIMLHISTWLHASIELAIFVRSD